jgi:hypothetical protein
MPGIGNATGHRGRVRRPFGSADPALDGPPRWCPNRMVGRPERRTNDQWSSARAAGLYPLAMRIAGIGFGRALRGIGIATMLAAIALLGAPAGPAAAAGGESIRAYDVRINVRGDGTLRVEETIRYDFGANDRHGIRRRIPARFRYDDTQDRLYPVDDVVVTRDGAVRRGRRLCGGPDARGPGGTPTSSRSTG